MSPVVSTVSIVLSAETARGVSSVLSAGVGLTAFVILVASLLVTMQFDRHRWEDGGSEPGAPDQEQQTDAATSAGVEGAPRTRREAGHPGRHS